MAGGILDQVRDSLDALRERLWAATKSRVESLRQFAQKNNVAVITATQTKATSMEQEAYQEDYHVVDSVPSYEEIQQMIRDAAYFKWEAAGYPDGEQDRFWKEAEQELFGDTSEGYKFYVREGDSWVVRAVAA